MTLVVYALGAVLVLAGGICIAMGLPVVHLEQGWTAIIAGSVAGTAGFVIVVLGVFLQRLQALQLVLEALASTTLPMTAPLVPDQPRLTPESIGEPAPDPDETVAALDRFALVEPVLVSRPATVAPAQEASRDLSAPQPKEEPSVAAELSPAATIALPPNEPVEPAATPPSPPPPPAMPRRANFLASFLAKRTGQAGGDEAGGEAAAEPELRPLHEAPSSGGSGRTAIDLSSGWADDEPENREHEPEPARVEPLRAAEEPVVAVLPEPALDARQSVEPDEDHDTVVIDHAAHPIDVATTGSEPESEPEPVLPTIVGRYTAGSASYVMYSNGMIEVETETGIHQFASMQELKSFIEQQDRAPV